MWHRSKRCVLCVVCCVEQFFAYWVSSKQSREIGEKNVWYQKIRFEWLWLNLSLWFTAWVSCELLIQEYWYINRSAPNHPPGQLDLYTFPLPKWKLFPNVWVSWSFTAGIRTMFLIDSGVFAITKPEPKQTSWDNASPYSPLFYLRTRHWLQLTTYIFNVKQTF